MNSPHTSRLIHAGIELVVGSCITFWLNRKISSVSQKVCLLEDKLKFYESMLSQHHELIKKLYSILENTSHAAKIDKPAAVSKINSKVENMKTELPSEPLPVLRELVDPAPLPKGEELFSAVEPTDFINKNPTMADELDAILSDEIEDIRINQNSSLR